MFVFRVFFFVDMCNCSVKESFNFRMSVSDQDSTLDTNSYKDQSHLFNIDVNHPNKFFNENSFLDLDVDSVNNNVERDDLT